MNDQSNFLAHFETYLLAEKRVSKNTFLAYKKDVDQFLDFLKKEKQTIKTGTIDTLKKLLKTYKKQGLQAKTLSRKISSLKLFYSFLNERFGVENVAESLIFPKLEQKLPTYLTEKEIQLLFKSANQDDSAKGLRNKVMLYLLYASGMRASELINVRIEQIEFDTGFIKLEGKGNKERMVPLPKNVLDLLRFYIDLVHKNIVKDCKVDTTNKNYLFICVYKNQLKTLTRQALWGILKRILMSAGINKNISPHSLRHSLATHLLKNGANIRSLQLLLGHEQISTVQIYTHLENSQIRKVYDKKHPRA
ncbi:MAG: tyrosine-type recombinase/integrase [bacterium]